MGRPMVTVYDPSERELATFTIELERYETQKTLERRVDEMINRRIPEAAGVCHWVISGV